jgi:hypothetical protein
MSRFKVGYEIGTLRCRIEQLERQFSGPNDAERRPEPAEAAGRVEPLAAGIDFSMEPIRWEPTGENGFPPFLLNLFGYKPTLQYDIKPESKTWTCVPEPMIGYVHWDAGGIEEHFRMSDQVFTIIRVTDPNTGVVKATAIYSARLTGGNGRSIDYGVHGYVGPWFQITLRAAGGAGLFSYASRFSVWCGKNEMVNLTSDFPPGLFELVTGATWSTTGWRIGRC